MPSDGHDQRAAVSKRDGNDDAPLLPPPTTEAALSVVTSSNGGVHGLATASTSSMAPLLVGPASSPQSSNERHHHEYHEAGKLDVIGTTHAVKKLFSMSLDALSSNHNTASAASSSIQQQQQQHKKKATLLAIHNFDGTLIIDDAEDESNYDFLESSQNQNENYYHDDDDRRGGYSGFSEHPDRISHGSESSATPLLPPSSQSLALALSPATQAGNRSDQLEALSMLSTLVQSSNTNINNTNTNSSSNSKETSLDNQHPNPSSPLLAPPTAPREYVQWNFSDLNMLLGHDTLVVRPPESGGIAVRVEDVRRLQTVWEAFQRQQQQQQQQQSTTPSPHINDRPQNHPQSTSNSNLRSYAQALLQQEPEQDLPSPAQGQSQTIVLPKGTTTSETAKESNPHGISEVPLQTCIVPFLGPLGSQISPLEDSSRLSPESSSPSSPPGSVPPSASSVMSSSSIGTDSPALSIVLDAYLDNLMANVPQLALCLEEKGLIQSVKMLPTEEIPFQMLHPSTLDTSRPLDIISSKRVVPGDTTSAATASPTDHRRRNSRGSSSQLEEAIFSPQIMEMNASALLRFLKTNCTRNHATYLLRHEGIDPREGGESSSSTSTTRPPQNIQLYDVSSISTQKQKKWIWWLATMSYRFALRLRHLETASSKGRILSESQKRAIRDRQRSLFQQTLDLLQDLMDIDGKAHESMVASVREHMADTYLSSVLHSSPPGNGSGAGGDTTISAESGTSEPQPRMQPQTLQEMSISPSPPVVTATISAKASVGSPSSQPLRPSLSSSSLSSPTKAPQLPNSENAPPVPFSDSERHHRQPYAAVSVDALNKAQDHLVVGIKTLSTLLERDMEERRLHRETEKRKEEEAWKRSRRRQRRPRGFRGEAAADASTSNDRPEEEKEETEDGRIPRLSSAMILQLFGMNFKLVNISLRLAEHHLGNYYSSSAMQALRTAARRLNDAAHLLDHYKKESPTSQDDDEKRNESLQLQYIWLLEHCGHFARSFASDELWRDRGHASGDDVISVLSDVETVFVESRKAMPHDEVQEKAQSRFWQMVELDVLLKKSKGKISLQSLSGVVAPSHTKASQIEQAIEAANVVLAKENLLRRERRKVLVASCVSYSRAIAAFQFTVQQDSETAPDKTVLLNLLRQRLGDACNETGKVLLAALRSLLVSNQGSKKKNDAQLAAEALLDSAEFWFTRGLEAFDACKDTRNLALLRCNLCQSFKLRANSGFSKREDSSSSSKHAEDCLQQAADQLLTAHEDLGQRDVDPQTWDMVSEELAATFLVLGVRRRQSLLGSGNAPVIFQVMRLSPGEERSIVDPMERALKIYEQSDNAHQAAAVHYQLALTFSKLWTCQLNETNTRKKLSKAFEHYSSAFNYFSTHSRGNEPTFCLLCLDLASLYAAIPGEEGLMKSLGCCLDCCDTFSVEAITVSTSLSCTTAKSKADWYEKMETIAQSVDDRVFKLLRSLVKVDPVRYKDMYREGLTAKMVRNVPDEQHEEFDQNPKSSALLALHEVLLAVKKMYGVIVSKS